MKAIYDACRALLLEQRKDPQPLTEQQDELVRGLWNFERRNRGHRNNLEALAAAAQTSRYYSYTPDDTRKTTLADTTRWLLQDLAGIPEADMPQTAAFQAMYKAEDRSGLLRHVLLEAFRLSYARMAQTAYIANFKQTHEHGKWTLTLTFRHATRNLTAHRELSIAVGAVNTLQVCLRQLKAMEKALLALVQNVTTWPEFDNNAVAEELRTRARKYINDALRNFSQEDLRLLRDDLPKLLQEKLIAVA